MAEAALDATECLEFSSATCHGVVDYHTLDGLKFWPRCEAHQAQRVERYENSIEKEAQSSSPPSWFDPMAAGESWEEQ